MRTSGQLIGVKNDKYYKLGLSSGLIIGGFIEADADPAKVYLNEGSGVITDDWTDPENPVIYKVSWVSQTVTLTGIGSQTKTHIFIDTAGAVYQQEAAPDPEKRRKYIFLGHIGHTNMTTVGAIINAPDLYISPISQFRDLEYAIGIINNGIKISPNGANLKIDNSTGTLYFNGVNFNTDPYNPSNKTINSASTPTFRYRTQTGAGSSTDTIQPDYYDLSGTVTAIGSTKSTNQRIYIGLSGNIVIQYGQMLYNSFDEAVAAISTEAFTLYGNIDETFILLAVLSVQSNCSDLTDTTRAKITSASRFGELSAVGGSSGGGSGKVVWVDKIITRTSANGLGLVLANTVVWGAITIPANTLQSGDVIRIYAGMNTPTSTYFAGGISLASQATYGGTEYAFSGNSSSRYLGTENIIFYSGGNLIAPYFDTGWASGLNIRDSAYIAAGNNALMPGKTTAFASTNALYARAQFYGTLGIAYELAFLYVEIIRP